MSTQNFTTKSQEAISAALQSAAAKGNPSVEPAHLLVALLEQEDGIAGPLLRSAGVDPGALLQQAHSLVENLPAASGGGLANPNLSRDGLTVINTAQELASSMGDEYTSTEHLMVGLATGRHPVAAAMQSLGATPENLKAAFTAVRGSGRITSENPEDTYQALEKYSTDLTARAREGKIDPVIGRDAEIRRVVQVLSRRTKNNPVLIGEPGVGKTAIVEGLARRIVSGDVPESLRGKKLIALDLGSMIAGAKYRGEFEERLKSVLQEIKDANGEIVTFIDEIHTIVGAGATGDSGMDAGNLIKPMLARGELCLVGATTLDEYRKYIEKDAALERRFQQVYVGEPTVEDTIGILRGLKERYEVHHGVRIKDSALVAAATLSDRYITNRFLPDKAIDLMDEAASRMRMEIDSSPEEIDTAQRIVRRLEVEELALEKEEDAASRERLARIVGGHRTGNRSGPSGKGRRRRRSYLRLAGDGPRRGRGGPRLRRLRRCLAGGAFRRRFLEAVTRGFADESVDARHIERGASVAWRAVMPGGTSVVWIRMPLRSGRQSSESSTTRHRQNQMRQVFGRIAWTAQPAPSTQ